MSLKPRPSGRTPARIASRVDLFFDFDEDVANLLRLVLLRDDRAIAGVGIGDRRGHFGDQVVEDLLDGVGAVGLAGLALDFADLVGDACADGIDEARHRAA